MDNAVALVQAYLQVNGYFTVTEYPVLEAARHGIQTATDLDVLAFRFPGAGRLVPAKQGAKDHWITKVDPSLAAPAEKVDMLIGEVKEGRAELNRAACDPEVLRAVLVRFGCCSESHVPDVVERLLRNGMADMPSGHRVRLIAFGLPPAERPQGYHVVPLGHVADYLRSFLCEHWEILRHAEFKSSALGFLLMLEKARRGEGSHEE
jgi:hypothetical protein